MFILENPLKFAHWLQAERYVIGGDVDVDALWKQYVDDLGCYHDPAAQQVVSINECECGVMSLADQNED